MASQYLDPKILQRIERLDLKAKFIVEGFISGRHRSPYRGFSVEFAEHRGYVPGDDLKHLDWRVYARNERYVIKQYEEETNLISHILMDASESMAYGSTRATEGLTKLEYAKLITASLTYLILGQSDAVAVGIFDHEIKDYIERSTRDVHVHRICDALESLAPEKKTDMEAIFREFANRIRRRGIIVVISDLFDNVDNIISGIQRLRYTGSEVIVFHLLDENELAFPFEGLIEFHGLEAAGKVLCQPRMLKKYYLDEVEQYLSKIKAACNRNQVDYVQVNTSTPVEITLMAYLASRERAGRLAHGGAR